MGYSAGDKLKFDTELTKQQQLWANLHFLSSTQIPAPVHVPSAAYLSEMVGHTDIYQRRTDELEYRLRPTAGQLATQPASYHGYSSGASNLSEIEYRARLSEADRLHSSHEANALSDYNKSYRQPGGTGDSANLSVSSRYSFSGPSFAYQ